MSRAPRSHYFSVTQFRFDQQTPDDYEFPERVRYAKWQMEKCPTSGRLHLQMYVETKTAVTVKTLAKDFLNAHTEIMISEDGLKNYVMKDQTRIAGPYEYGESVSQGQRNDIKEFVKVMKQAPTLMALLEACPTQTVKYIRAADRIRSILPPPPRPVILSHFFHGVSGGGKSHKAHEMYPNAYIYVDNVHGWFDGYDGQTEVILDEFDGLTPLPMMLKLIDHYPHRMPIKGGFTPIAATKFIFTANHPPEQFYQGAPQWMRRLNHIESFKVPYSVESSITSTDFVASCGQSTNFLEVIEQKHSHGTTSTETHRAPSQFIPTSS